MGNKLSNRIISSAEGELDVLDLKGLKVGGAANNRKKPMPENVAFALLRFIKIDASSTGLTMLPEDLAPFRHKLASLQLESNKLTKIPPSVGALTNLISLNLCDNNLSELPPEIGSLSSLRTIVLHRNNLRELPEELARLPSLVLLYCGGNKLQRLPPALWECTSLQQVHLQQNFIVSIPAGINKAVNLKVLNLRTNRLTYLQDAFTKEMALERLEVWDNKLTCLPDSLGSLTSLKILRVHKNRIRELPYTLGNLHLVEITLKGNPLQGVFKKLRNTPDTNKVMEVLRSVAGADTQPVFFADIDADEMYLEDGDVDGEDYELPPLPTQKPPPSTAATADPADATPPAGGEDKVEGGGGGGGGDGDDDDDSSHNTKAYSVMKHAVEALRWIRSCLGRAAIPPGVPAALASNSLYLYEPAYLRDGSMLCHVANAVRENAVKKVYTVVSEKTIELNDALIRKNIQAFLSACTSLGVPSSALFEESDLMEARNLPRVFDTVHALAACAAKDSQCTLPPLISLDHYRFRSEQIALAAFIVGGGGAVSANAAGAAPLAKSPPPTAASPPSSGAGQAESPQQSKALQNETLEWIAGSANANHELSPLDVAIKDLLESEVAYGRMLDTIVDTFAVPLNSPGLLTPEECKLVFANIDRIYALERSIAGEAKEILSECEVNWAKGKHADVHAVASLFLSHAHEFHLYAGYARLNHNAADIVNAKAEELVNLASFLDDALSAPQCRMLTLKDILYAPVKRIKTEYISLLEAVVDHVDALDDARGAIEKALAVAARAGAYVAEEERRSQWCEWRLHDLRANVDGWAAHGLLYPPPAGQELLSESMAVKISSGKKQERVFFILNNALVYCKEKKGAPMVAEGSPHDLPYLATRAPLEVCDAVRHERLIVRNAAGDGKKYDPAVSLEVHRVDKKKTYILAFASAAIRDEWVSELARARNSESGVLAPRLPADHLLVTKAVATARKKGKEEEDAGAADRWDDDGLGSWTEKEKAMGRRLTNAVGLKRPKRDVRAQCLASSQLMKESKIVLLEMRNACTPWGQIRAGTYDGIDVSVELVSFPLGEKLRPTMEELDNLKKLRHVNVVQVLGALTLHPSVDGQGSLLAVVSDPLSTLTLARVLQAEGDATDLWLLMKLATDVVRGMAFMHTMGAIHGNLGLQTIVVDRKLSRASVSSFALPLLSASRSLPYTVQDGAPQAPEIATSGVSQATDVFAFGAILVAVATGLQADRQLLVPREVHTAEEEKAEGPRPALNMPQLEEYYRNDWPEMVTSVTRACLAITPSHRPLFPEIEAVLDLVYVGGNGADMTQFLGQAITALAGQSDAVREKRTWSDGGATWVQQTERENTLRNTLRNIDDLMDGMFAEEHPIPVSGAGQ